MMFLRPLALGSAAVLLATVTVSAEPRHHNTSRLAQGDRTAHPQPDAGGWQAEAIARATREMQEAPGVTNELAPDAKATATGGPSGGVPGFSGH